MSSTLLNSTTFLHIATYDGYFGVQVDRQLYGEVRNYATSVPVISNMLRR